ncbi:MAG: nucleotide sugar dehydrogenase [Candidatus Omnitrophota bacterium]
MNCLKQLRRFFSGMIAVTFFVTNTLVPAPIAHAANVESPAFISSFTIPVEFGKVTDRIKGFESGSLLIHIQEAHANYDAQKNIKNILEHLSKNYGIRLVLLEGAGNKLDATLFKFFPKELELQEAVNEKLMQAGELTGAEVFLMDQTLSGVRSAEYGGKKETNSVRRTQDAILAEGYGVEKAEAYAKNREAFKRVFEGRELAQDFLETFYRQWQKYASLLPNKPLKEFLIRETAFEEGRLPLADWMIFLKTAAARNLRLDLDHVLEQKDWPVLVRYFRLKAIDPKIDTTKVKIEQEKFLAEINALEGERRRVEGARLPDGQVKTEAPSPILHLSPIVKEVTDIFEQSKKNDLPAYKTRFVLEKLLDRLPKDFSFDAYPNLRLYLQQIILLSEIQGDALQDEIKYLTGKLTARLIKTEQDRQFAEILHDFRLVKKLFALELSRSEYQTILSDKITLEKLLQELQAQDPEAKVLNKNPSPKLLRLQSLYGTAIRFYEGAIKRENWMMKQAFVRMQERKQTKAVLITGGFHTEGLKEKVLSTGSSYVEITPRIGEVASQDRENYLRALLGGNFSTTRNAQRTTQDKTVAHRTLSIERSEIAALVRSDMRFLKEVFPKNWRRELAEFGTNLRGKLRQVVSSDRAQKTVSDFLAAAMGVPASQPAAARSEMRQAMQDVASAKPDLPGLTLGLSLDIGSERRGAGLVEFGAFKKAARLLAPLKESFGMGRVYPYNSLFEMSDISRGVHQVPDRGEHFITSPDGKTTVRVVNYETKREEVSGVTLRDDKGNSFSIFSMLKLNPHLSDSNAGNGTAEKTQRDVIAFNKKAHKLGIKTVADFIPWLAPDAIDENNLDWVFHEKLIPEENQHFRNLSHGDKQAYINSLIREKGGAFFVRRIGRGDNEEVVLIRHLPGMGIYNVDQALLNVYSPKVQDYFKRSLRFLIDLGFDTIRVDTGSLLLKENLSGFLAGAGLSPETSTQGDPLREIMRDASGYAKQEGRSFEPIFETYGWDDQKALIEAGDQSGVAVYEDGLFWALLEFARNPAVGTYKIAEKIKEVLLFGVQHPGEKKKFLLYPTNFDQNALQAMGKIGNGFSVAGVLALSLVTAYLAGDFGVVNVFLILRDMLGQSGDVHPIVGGDILDNHASLGGEHAHPFVRTSEELAARTDIRRLEQAIREASSAKFLKALFSATKESHQTYIQFLDNADRQRVISLGWKNEKEEWVVFAVNLSPRQGPLDLRFIEFPSQATENIPLEGWEAKDALTGELFSIVKEIADGKEFPRILGVSFKDEDYRLIVLAPKEEKNRSEARGVTARSETRTLDEIATAAFRHYRTHLTGYVEIGGSEFLINPRISNSLVLLIKPSIGPITQKTIAEILRAAKTRGYFANAIRVVTSHDIREQKIMERHYPRHTDVATKGWAILSKREQDVLREHLAGLSFSKELLEASHPVLSASEFMEKTGLSAEVLAKLWAASKNVRKLSRGARAFRVGLITLSRNANIPARYRGATLPVLNGFLPALTEDFTKAKYPTVAIWFKKDPEATGAATLQQMQEEFAGEINPEEAAQKHPDSLRGRAFRKDHRLGLLGEKMTPRKNFIHLTAPEDIATWAKKNGFYSEGEFHAWFNDLSNYKPRKFPAKGLKKIADGEAKGFEYFGAREARDYMNGAAFHLSGFELTDKTELAYDFITGFQVRTAQLKRISDKRREKALFYYSKADFKGFEGMKPSEFLKAKGVSLEQVRGKNIHVIDKYSGMPFHRTIPHKATDLAKELKPFEGLNVTTVSDLDLLWVEKTSNDSEEQDEAVDKTSRSEMRAASEKAGLEAYTVVSRQLEAGLDRSILEALNRKLTQRFQGMGSMIRRYVGLVAETTLTGGLGALMHDLFPAWAQNLGLQNKPKKDLLAINVIYDRIKGQQYAKHLPDEVRQGKATLGDYLRSVLKMDKSLRLSFKLEIEDDFRHKAADEKAWAEQNGSPDYKEATRKAKSIIGKKIYVDIYPTETHFNQAPNYYIDAYFYNEKKEKIRVFDEIYPDAPYGHPNLWRDVHMAVYGWATQHLVRELQKKGVVKNKILFVDNEVFVSTPTPMFPDAVHHHVNHTVFRPGLYMPDEASYEMLGYPETQRKFITQNGKINVVDAVGISSRLITGVALYEHTAVLADDIMAAYPHKLVGYNENGVRNTNGVLLEQWQSPILRSLIDQYKRQLGIQPEVPDKEFFELLSSAPHAAALESFKQKAEFTKAVGIIETLLWLTEDQNFPGWLDAVAAAYKEKAGLERVDEQKLIEDFRRAVELAMEDPEAWQALTQREDLVFLKEFLFKDPILANVRRQVSYKGPDKWIEILEKLKSDPQALAEFKAKAPRVIIGGREFGDEAHWMFLRIQSLIGELGLQDRIATIDDYNIYIAPTIAQGVSGAVMLSDEKLEAASTFTMKVMTNMGVLIGVWGGADPELFTIVDMKAGREIDIFKEKVTHDILVAKLESKEWKITNGFLVAYSNTEQSTQVGGGRRPSAASLLQDLYDLNDSYQDPSGRRDLQFAVLRSTPKVDMARGQAAALKTLWERTIRILQEEDELFDGLEVAAEDTEKFFKKSLAQNRQPEFIWHGTAQDAWDIAGILGFIQGFRYLKMKGRESYNSIAHHATQGEKGDIFSYLENFFEGFNATLTPVINKIHELARQAQAAQTMEEKVKANLEALEIVERMAVEISYHLLEHYIRTQDKKIEAYLANPVVRENIAIYLERHAVPFRSIAKKIRGYAVDINGQKYLVALNLGEYDFPSEKGEKAWGSLYGREAAEGLVGSDDDFRIYQVVDAISGESHGKYSLWKMAETIPVGVPFPGVQVMKLVDSGERTEKQEISLGKDVVDYLEALTNGRLVSDEKPITQLLFQKVKDSIDDPEKMTRLLRGLTNLSRDEAVAKFGEKGVPAVMAFVTILSPGRLEKIKDWNSEVYEALSGMIQQPDLEGLFRTGKTWFHRVDRDSAIVISRSLSGKKVVVPIHFSATPFRSDDGKAWFRVLDVDRLGLPLSEDARYQVYNVLSDTIYPLEHSGKELSDEKWSIGVPVEVPQDPTVLREPPYRFQALEVIPAGSVASQRSEMRAENAWPQHEAQKIAVIGTGFVGATKAILLVTDWGHDVIAVDIQPQIVEKLSSGKLTFHANDLQELLTEGLRTGKLKFTTDYTQAIEGREIIFLAVQTPQSETGHANINYLKDSVREIARLVHPGESKILIGKSTAPPRDTVATLKAVVAEEFQRREAAGEDLQGATIHFAWEPEFLREGKEVEDDRGVAGRVVIGADDPEVALKIKQLYAHANPDPGHARTNVPVVLTDLTSAPLVKYAANGYRGMKISYINFISWLTEALGLNIDQVAHDIATRADSGEEDRRIGRAFLSAGLGFGGSCFPKDLASAVQISRGLGVLPGLVLDALAVNELQWKRFVEKLVIHELQNVQGKTIVVLGASFKPGTDDIRESRAVKVISKLLGRGAKIRVYDPVAVERLRDPRIGPFKDDTAIEYYSDPSQLNAMLENSDAVILATEWPDFDRINFENLRHWFVDHKKALPPIFDGRNFFKESKVNDPELIRQQQRYALGLDEKSLKFPYFNIGHGEMHSKPLVPHNEFVERVRESFLALRISYINMIAEIAERVGANIRDVKRGLGLDFVVGEEYLAPGIGWGGNKLSTALEDLEGYVEQYLSEQLLQEFQKTRQAIQQKFEFPRDTAQSEALPVPFITTVRKINDQQIALYLEKAKKAAGGDLRGKIVAVLGLAYKPGEFATYQSRALNLIEALLQEGAIVRATDVDRQAVTNARRDLDEMHVPRSENLTLVLESRTAQENARETVRGSEIQILVTASSAFANVVPIFFDEEKRPVAKASKMVDGRHFYDPADLKKQGIEYFAVGVPSPASGKETVLEDREQAKVLVALKESVSFPEKSIKVRSQEDGRILASLKVRINPGMLGKVRFFSHFGFYAGDETPWQDQEVDAEREMTLLNQEGDWENYEIHAVIDPRKSIPGRSGELGVTFFASPAAISRQEASFITQRLKAGDQGVHDGKIEVKPEAAMRSEMRRDGSEKVTRKGMAALHALAVQHQGGKIDDTQLNIALDLEVSQTSISKMFREFNVETRGLPPKEKNAAVIQAQKLQVELAERLGVSLKVAGEILRKPGGEEKERIMAFYIWIKGLKKGQEIPQSTREIALKYGVAQSTVQNNLERKEVKAGGLTLRQRHANFKTWVMAHSGQRISGTVSAIAQDRGLWNRLVASTLRRYGIALVSAPASAEKTDLEKGKLVAVRSEMRTELPQGIRYQDQVRVVESANWFFQGIVPQDRKVKDSIDRTIERLSEIIREAVRDQKPVLLSGVAVSSDDDQLFEMLGFAPATTRQDAERETLFAISDAVRNDPGIEFWRSERRLHFFAAGERRELILKQDRGEYSKLFKDLIGNRLKGQEDRLRGANSFDAAVRLNKIAVASSVKVEYGLRDLAALANWLSLDPEVVRGAVITQAEYKNLPATKPAEKAITAPKPVTPPSPEMLFLLEVLSQIQTVWAEREAHWAVQQVHEETAALAAWDQPLKFGNNHIQKEERDAVRQYSETAADIYFAKTGVFPKQGLKKLIKQETKEVNGRRFLDETPYRKILERESALRTLINSPIEAEGNATGPVRKRIERIFSTMIELRELLGKRVFSISKLYEMKPTLGIFRQPHSEVQHLFAKHIAHLLFVRKTGSRALNDQGQGFAGFVDELFRSKDIPLEREGQNRAVPSSVARGALADLRASIEQRKDFYDAKTTILADTIGRMYGDILRQIEEISGIEEEQAFMSKFRQMLNDLGMVLANDDLKRWFTGIGEPSAGQEIASIAQMEVIGAVMEPFFADVSEKSASSAPRSEIRTVAAVATLMPTETITDSQLIEKNRLFGGGGLQGFRGVTEKITDGIWSLVVHTVNAVNAVAAFFGMADSKGEMLDVTTKPRSAFEKTRTAAARSVLGLKSLTSSDGFVLGKDLAFKDGALIVMRKVFGETPAAVLASYESLSSADRRLFDGINAQLVRAHRPPILMAPSLEEARKLLVASTPSLNLKALVNVTESSAITLKQQLGDNAILVTSQHFRAFLASAGVAALVEKMQNEYLATARSA